MLGNWIKQNGSSHTRPSQQTNGAIELHGVVKKYEGTASTVTALNGIDLQVNAGEFVVVLGKEMNWQVVGIAHLMMGDGPTVYVNTPYLASAVGLRERADWLYIHTAQHDSASQLLALQELDRQFKSEGIRITSTMLIADLRTTIRALFDAVVVVLMIMAVLLSIVGGLGLMGIMSLNVLERSREIGVMRAIGASDNALLRVILIEGILIGLVSWLVGCVMAWPLSQALSNAVGMAMIQTPLTFTFSAAGVLIWLALVVVLTSTACYLPARNACQITIRETLAYE